MYGVCKSFYETKAEGIRGVWARLTAL